MSFVVRCLRFLHVSVFFDACLAARRLSNKYVALACTTECLPYELVENTALRNGSARHRVTCEIMVTAIVGSDIKHVGLHMSSCRRDWAALLCLQASQNVDSDAEVPQKYENIAFCMIGF